MRYSTFRWLALLVLSVTGLAAQAQSEQVVQARIAWAGTEPVAIRGKLRQLPSFRGASFRKDEQVGTYQVRLAGAVSQGQLRDAVYEPLTTAEARQLDAAALPTAPVVELITGLENRQPITLLALRPARRNPQTGQPEKLVSFSYAYTPGSLRPTTTRTYTRTSVLGQGDWFKIGVPNSGVYKLDKAALSSLGLNTQSLDPTRLRLYGNAMGTLPQANSTYRPDDLVENAVQFVGDGNTSFDDNEYFLFYARGPHTWSREGQTASFRHQQNPYTDTAYYFLTVGTAAGRRVAAAPAVSGTASARITTFAERQFYERELLNLAKSGRVWVGEQFSSFSGLQREVSFSVTDLVPGSIARVTSAVVAASVSTTTFQTAINGQNNTTQVVSGFTCTGGGGCYPEAANTARTELSYPIPATSPTDVKVSLTYNGGTDPSARGYLDYLELNALRQLRMSGNQLEFRSLSNLVPGAISQFEVGNAVTGTTIWDVTNPRRPAAVSHFNGTYLARTDSVREYVAFTGNSFPTPRSFGRVGNQNLHALNLDGKLELIVLTHPAFLEAANKLAAHRTTHDGLVAQVVTTTQIYNEFGSGAQDVTAIRDFMKMVYDRNTTGRRQYLLLFGDASYDYKADPSNDAAKLPDWWKDRLPANADKINQNFVPVYESVEGFDYVQGYRPGGQGITYSSDDYYGLLDDTEGAWLPNTSNELMDIAIGRLPVRTAAMALATADKIIGYDGVAGFGKWRNRLSFVADDGDNNLFSTYSDQLANPLETTPATQSYNVYKQYLDLFPQTTVAAGQRSPSAEKAVDEAFEKGSLLINYVGHGSPRSWADEQILTSTSVQRLQNTSTLPFLFTGTCDFSTYDNPEFTSAGEIALTDISGGAIGLLTTTRVVYADKNQSLAIEFFNELFRPQADGTMPRIGEVCRGAKNTAVAGDNNRNYALLGDPSMRLAYPKQEAVVTTLNGKPIAQTDTLKALQQVTLRGEIQQGSRLNPAFNGTANVQVFEKKTIVQTLGNEANAPAVPITLRENVLYDGPATVRNGSFNVQFVVPKDINYNVGLGKISLYASDAANRTDAHGQQLLGIGDAAPLAYRDTIPPRIRLFMDNEQFAFGGLTGLTTTLLGVLRDESGINTAGTGIGHDLTATLDGDASKVTILNSFYTAKTDSFQVGRVEYKFKDLKSGPHELRVKAWDTWNNSSERSVEFVAAATEKLALQHVLNYPNPFARNTTFHFDHNRQGEDLDIQVQIFTVAGKLVRTLQATALGSGSHVSSISWDGRDEYQDQLARGVYVYRVSVRAHSANSSNASTTSKYEKLVLLN
ncbi:type IX secretion system sortase PorU [Hymenobacter endophyticus]|uniref:Type IX secretion system sortase PorU n=1 Tax=Hymenobacter endophyticus TaxID=3076335 RepID=A0ABU3TMS2_9BACT|nr:type IX secretion system sortase PorU [Hymenobacter endophyticus]MDU0372627.1 type IX secretion system sortase PorU [Hymenobacter endophyticus]